MTKMEADHRTKRLAILDDYQEAASAVDAWQRLHGRVDIDVFRDTLTCEDELVERLAPYEILVTIRERTKLTSSVLRRLPKLELLVITGPNTGQVDESAACECGILLIDTAASSDSAFELTVGLMLAIMRRIPQEDRALRRGEWQTGIGTELKGKTLGILGLGHIGTRLALFGHSMDMRVIAWDRPGPTTPPGVAGVARASLERLFGESDVVSIHLRLSSTSRCLVTAELLGRMKPTAFIINTARGGIVDTPALLEALVERRIAGAALDVYDTEPLPKDHPLLKLDNVVLTPHVGFVTREMYSTFFAEAVENILCYLDERLPPRCLNPETWPGNKGSA